MPHLSSTVQAVGSHEIPAPPQRLVHRGRNLSKADVFRIDSNDSAVALKTYRERPWWIRQTLGRLMTRRESRAYRGLGGVPGLVTYLGRPDPWTLALEFVEGVPLASAPRQDLTRSQRGQLIDTVEAIHQRGWVLLDLHHQDVLVDCRNGRLWVVDFGTASAHAGLLRGLDDLLLGKLLHRYWSDPPPRARGPVGVLWRAHRHLGDAWRRLRRALTH